MSLAPGVESFAPRVDEAVIADLRERLGRTRWPAQPGGGGWELGVDLAYLRELCEHWAGAYDFGASSGPSGGGRTPAGTASTSFAPRRERRPGVSRSCSSTAGREA